MQKNPPSSFCASAAIVVALALGSTGALAQETTAEVPAVAPPAPAAAAPAPAQAPVMTQSPVVQTIPATPMAEPAAAIRNPPRVAAAPRQTAPRTATRSASAAAVAIPAVTTPPRVPAPVSPTSAVPAAPVAAPLPEPAPLPATATQPTEDGLTGAEAGLLGLLAVTGLGGAALIATRSRRRRPVEGEALEVAPMVETVPEPERAAASPERFAMPAGPVPTDSERDELLKRMVAAPPDEANPFISRKRRVHRARILLAERERELRDRSTERSAEPFDWRTYRPTGANAAQRAEVPGAVPNPT